VFWSILVTPTEAVNPAIGVILYPIAYPLFELVVVMILSDPLLDAESKFGAYAKLNCELAPNLLTTSK